MENKQTAAEFMAMQTLTRYKRLNRITLVLAILMIAIINFGVYVNISLQSKQKAVEKKMHQLDSLEQTMILQNRIEIRRTVEKIQRHGDSLVREWKKNPHMIRGYTE